MFDWLRQLASRLVPRDRDRDDDRDLLADLHKLVSGLTGMAYRALMADDKLRNEMRDLMASLDALTAAVEAQRTVVQSAITLLQGLADAIGNAGTDQTALDELRANIEAQTSALAEAVAANTPASTPPVEGEPEPS